MSIRDKAKSFLRAHKFRHVVYGWSTGSETFETDQETEMVPFLSDEEYQAFVQKLLDAKPDIQAIFAVHENTR